MSDGEATPHGGIDTDPEAETRAAATDGEIHDAMPLVTANRDAPEGIAPANRNGPSRPAARPPAPDAPPLAPLTANGLKAVDQLVEQAGLGPLPPNRYLDREESWLRFNQRVLELAEDDTVPLLERVRFLAIFASNLDEFFMVRVAGLMRRMAAGLPVEGVSVQLPGQVLNRTLELAGRLTARHAACFSEQVSPALSADGIEILRWKELSSGERDNLRELFRERIYPVLTPLVVDPAHPFPFISGLSLNLAVMVADPRTGASMFARVKVPPLLPRFLAVSPQRFVPIEDVSAAHLTHLLAGLAIVEDHVFRVTRVRDLEVDEDVTEDLLQALERELLRRRFDPAVRLEVEETMSSDGRDPILTELGVDRRAVYRVPGPLDLSGLSAIADL